MQISKLEDKCNECMLCVRDCVSGVWRIVDGKPMPTNPDLCNRCSHCIAVCPCDAIRHDSLKAEQIRKVDRKSLNPDVYRDIILSRRSIRQFKDEAVPRAVIEQVLDLARYAPSASNNQNVGYIIVTDKKVIEETAKSIFGFTGRLYNMTKKGIGKMLVNITGMSNNRYLKIMGYAQKQNAETGRDFVLHHAPVLILIHAPKNVRFASDNCYVAATTIINYAHALGLGTCLVGLMNVALRYSGTLRKKLVVPKNRRVYASLVMGYPAYRHTNTVSRKKAEVHWL